MLEKVVVVDGLYILFWGGGRVKVCITMYNKKIEEM